MKLGTTVVHKNNSALNSSDNLLSFVQIIITALILSTTGDK